MSMMDTRNLNRDSLFLTAVLRRDADSEGTTIKVRNLSDGGMMAEGVLALSRGDRLTVELRNLNPVAGTVAWTQGNRVGIAFDEEIDAKAARARPVSSQTEAPRYSRPIGTPNHGGGAVRKV